MLQKSHPERWEPGCRGPAMSSLPYLAALVCIGIIIFWYVRDEAVRDGKGNSGLLDMGGGELPAGKSKGPRWKTDKEKRPWRPRGH